MTFQTSPRAHQTTSAKILKATHAHDQKSPADIVTMNLALSDVFLANLPKSICETYKPIRMKQENTVFLHMFDWFVRKYKQMTTKDHKAK